MKKDSPQWISDEESTELETGSTGWFAKTITLEAAEVACDFRRAKWEWEIVID